LNTLRRILYYTHNSIGIGHVFRARAIITGIRRRRPDIDFLVLSGTSVPHILLREGIEVVKLPGIEKMMSLGGMAPPPSAAERGNDGRPQLFKPRNLRNMPLEDVLELRRMIIGESLRWFRPEAVLVEHYLGGLLGEMTAVLQQNRLRAAPDRFVSAALSRGITGRKSEMLAAGDPDCPENMVDCFDFIYILDDGAEVEREGHPGEGSASGTPQPAYLGRITDKTLEELPSRKAVSERFRLTEKPIILLSLSRHGKVAALCRRLFEVFQWLDLDDPFQLIFVIDPYLKKEVLEDIRRDPFADRVRFLPFFYPLVDLIQTSELVICRAGYNTINELLLTGVKALVIPEAHPSGEQEARVKTIPRDNIVVLGEEEVLREPPVAAVQELLGRRRAPRSGTFDKYAIGRRLITDLEGLFFSRRDFSGAPSLQ
jgi:predicted glycosyltransferase